MKTKDQITITNGNISSLPKIKSLWRINSATLGYFPDGAFEDHLYRKQILVAVDQHDNLVGYLLYRISDSKISVVHLCVAYEHRGKGIAKSLMHALVEANAHYKGVGLKCRRDFDASKLWPSLGLVPYCDLIGKNKDGKMLTYWWMDFGHPSLFSSALATTLKEKLCIAIDANIFFGFNADNDAEDAEAKSLLADWLPDTLEIFLTQEIFNEIDRETDPLKRAHQKNLAQKYPLLPYRYGELKVVSAYLKTLLPKPRSSSDESDIRQLSHAISSDVKFFVTRDQKLVDLYDAIYEKYGVSVLRPSDFIVRIDEMQKEEEYQPNRLTGTQFKTKLVQQNEIDGLADKFQNSSKAENKASFNKLLRRHLSNPTSSRCYLCYSYDSAPLALIVYSRTSQHELEIPVFRVRKGPLSSTITRHLIICTKMLSAKENRMVTAFTDECISDETISILEKESFSESASGWRKLNLRQAGASSEISANLKALHSSHGVEYGFCASLAKIIDTIPDDDDKAIKLLEIERHIWPAKLLDAGVPCFIVPIKPEWALQLFDADIGNQDLLGASELVFNRELVYYRSKRPGVLKVPGRILWYVSSNSSYEGTGQIRACSYVDEVTVGKPKDLYKKYRRLGIYQWKNVIETAKDNLDQEIMAITFSDTHLLEHPLEWKIFQKVLKSHSVKTNLQSPVKIKSDVFKELYLGSIETGKGASDGQ
jgi:predicted nucleic acid-binding protein/predicted GNAT family acetyltransferase